MNSFIECSNVMMGYLCTQKHFVLSQACLASEHDSFILISVSQRCDTCVDMSGHVDFDNITPTLRDGSCSRNSKNYTSDVTFNYVYSNSQKVSRIKSDVLTPVNSTPYD